LSATEAADFNLPMTWHSLTASEIHHIPLFGEDMVKTFDDCKSYFLLKLLLLPYITWLDHSILECLALSSQNTVAKNILEQFTSSTDYTKPITSYPIPSPSQLMIPLDGSDYTLVATQCDFEFKSLVLQNVVDIRNVLVKLWQITPHAIQLTAVHEQERLLYWMIPKSVAGLIASRTPDIQYELWENGIVMCAIFPVDFFSLCYTEIKPGPFSLLNFKVYVSVMYCLQVAHFYFVHAVFPADQYALFSVQMLIEKFC